MLYHKSLSIQLEEEEKSIFKKVVYKFTILKFFQIPPSFSDVNIIDSKITNTMVYLKKKVLNIYMHR